MLLPFLCSELILIGTTGYMAIREYPDDVDHLYSNNESQWLIVISVAMPLQPT